MNCSKFNRVKLSQYALISVLGYSKSFPSICICIDIDTDSKYMIRHIRPNLQCIKTINSLRFYDSCEKTISCKWMWFSL